MQFDEIGRRIDFQLQLIEIIKSKIIATWSPSLVDNINSTRSENESVQAVIDNLQKTTIIVSSK